MLLETLKPRFQVMELKKYLLPSCKSVLDVGCGRNSNLRHIKSFFKLTTGIDAFGNDLNFAKKSGTHDKYISSDIRNIGSLFKPKAFDAVIAMDVVEHLTKKEALNLIKSMERIAKRVVIVGTPNGFVPQHSVDDNKYQIHKCGFTSEELTRFGYSVIGMDGPKYLRGEAAEIRLKPKIFFSMISNLLDPFMRRFPKISYSLFAIKKLAS